MLKRDSIKQIERRKKHWAKEKNITWMDGMPLTYNEILTFYNNDNLKDMLQNLIKKKLHLRNYII